jgi:hypothetical protein
MIYPRTQRTMAFRIPGPRSAEWPRDVGPPCGDAHTVARLAAAAFEKSASLKYWRNIAITLTTGSLVR